MVERLFVYGTLAPGGPNEHVLADVPGSWEPATVAGTLLQRGWGAVVGYPGIVLGGGAGEEVRGLLFSSEELHEHWERLDDFEGDGYERVLTSARLNSGEIATSFVYAVRGASTVS
ncbi:MAG TPA: gamma-glutamylcyclotransferase family protein [Nocardioides sp.]|uniref:gamma-glutamylcyclotransferase family protein n=1 Tax=Nocardioides sp. TaxID=35761 RepID=UPI002D7EA1D8|nr:gamma-glutamylcyclotransferase family protein [Nocardioides sp.]HET6652488.1 gamma-glutamylcyclotransferase family protein [Nocardioides sp.]